MQGTSAGNWRPLAGLSARSNSSLTILAAVCLVLLNTFLHAQVYGNRNYREDEVVVVHEAVIWPVQSVVQSISYNNHPPGWRMLSNAWIKAVGIGEEVTRWLSKLTNILTFALIFQLGKNIRDSRAGLYAIALLGLYGFASNGIFELRPYAMLVMLATALHLVFYRWLRKPSGRLMVAYCALGIAAIYTHYYAFPIFATHALYLLAFRRYDRRIYFHTFMMWFFIALSFTAWLPALLQTVIVTRAGGYPSLELADLVQALNFQPTLVFEFLLLLSVAALIPLKNGTSDSSGTAALRRYPQSKYAYPLFLLLATFIVAIVAHEFWRLLNPRGFMSVVTLIALVLATGLWLLPARAGAILLFLLYLYAPTNIALQPTNAPYRDIVQEMASSYEDDSLVVTEFNFAWRWLMTAAYYLMDFTPDRMSRERIYHLVAPPDTAQPVYYPEALVNIHESFEPEHFSDQLTQHKQLWHLRQGGGNELGVGFADWLNRNYALVRSVSWPDEYVTSYSLSEYSRVPANQGPILNVGDNLRLYVWELRDSVQVSPCQSVTIESWWQTVATDTIPHSISIILADSDGDGQLAITDAVPADEFTINWTPERYYRDRTTITLPCDIGEGSFDLLLAAKESMSGEPLTLAYPSGDTVGHLYYLTTLHVK